MPHSVPAVVAHGGALASQDTLPGVKQAVQKAAHILIKGGSAVDAAVEACVLLEDNPVFNAGTGAAMRINGSVQLDASVQSSDGNLGFVTIMENTPNPVRVAADLLSEKINGLAGRGAREWADLHGHIKSKVIARSGPIDPQSDTVGIVTRDKSGKFAVASSTGGYSQRPEGRVGDVSLPGCGFWTQNGVAVATTGNGEVITSLLLSYRVAQKILDGYNLTTALAWGIKLVEDDECEVGIIALGAEGIGASLCNKNMPTASWHDK